MVSVYSHLDFGVLRRVTSMYFHTDTIEIFGRRNAAGENSERILSDAEAEVRSLAQLYANMGRNADALAQYFGEDLARCPSEQVVTTLLNFVRMFIRGHGENCKKIEYDKKKVEKEANRK
ncbi:formin protein [Trifolium repens]|nr:formin protein [Trifolium repens]